MKMNFKQNSVKLAIAAGLVGGSLSVTLPVFAVTGTTDLIVKASIGNACVLTTDELNFSTYDPNASTDHTVSTKIKTTCTNGTTGTIKIGVGLNGTGENTAPTRRMLHTTVSDKYLNYDVYTDEARNVQWNHTDDKALSGTGSETFVTVYGEIPKGQTTAIAGDYKDTLVVTINY